VELQVATATTRVEVTAEAPLVEDAKSGVAQVVSQSQIDGLPINGRRADTFVLLTPAVTPDGTFGLVSFRGISSAIRSSPTATTPPTASTTKMPAAPVFQRRSRRTRCRSSRCFPTGSPPSSGGRWAGSSTPSRGAVATTFTARVLVLPEPLAERSRPLRARVQPAGVAAPGRGDAGGPIVEEQVVLLQQL